MLPWPILGRSFRRRFGSGGGGGTAPTLFDNLAGYWPLDEADGTRYNTSRDADHAADGSSVAGVGGKAVFVAASTDYLSIADSVALSLGSDTAFTLAIRFTPLVTVAGTQAIVAYNTDDNNNTFAFWLYRTGSEIRLRVGNGTTFTSVTTSGLGLTIGQEYQIVAGYDKVTQRLSVKVDAGTTIFAAWTGGTINSAGTIQFGRLATAVFYLDGRLRDFHYWNGRYLTTAEQTSILNNPYPFGDTTYGISTLAPNLASGGYAWHDFSDASQQFTDAGKTTPVVSDADPIRVITSKVGSHDWVAPSAGVRPLYKTNVQNSLAVGRWNGSDSQLNMDEAWPDTDYTAFLVVKNNDVTVGSHVVSDNLYLALTSAGYSGTPRVALHFNNSPTFSSMTSNLINVDGWTIIEIVRSGNNWSLLNNGQNLATLTVAANFSVGHVGPWVNTDSTWWADMDLADSYRASVAHDARTRAQIRAYFAAKWAVTHVRINPYRVS